MAEHIIPLEHRHNHFGGGSLWNRQKPILAFKHVSADLGDQFASGESIQIATYDYYRNMEGPRADPMEGKLLNWSGKGDLFQNAKYGNPHAAALMDRVAGLDWRSQPADANIIIRDLGLAFVQPPAYLFCASLAPDLALLAQGQRIFLISDLIEFAAQMCRIAPQTLTGFSLAPVRYGDVAVNVLHDGVKEGDPFLKDKSYRLENEVRIVFETGSIPSDPLRLKLPFMPRLVTEIFGPFRERGTDAHVRSRL